MLFSIDEQGYSSSFEGSKKGFQHNKGNLIKLFPFATELKELPESSLDLINFYGVAGKFHRSCLGMEQTSLLPKDQLIQLIVDEVDAGPNKEDLEDIIEELLFDKNDHLILFSFQVLPHLGFQWPNAKLKNLENFICNLLIDDEVKQIIESTISDNVANNILYQLVLDKFKNITSNGVSTYNSKGYYEGLLVKEIRNLFKEDLSNLIQNKSLFTEKVSTLIKFYYFQYILKLTTQLGNLFSDNPKPSLFYFSLDWEKLSKSRLAIDNGWRKLEKLVEPMFAHANCLELLHTIQSEGGFLKKCFTYKEIQTDIEQMDEESEKELTLVVNKLINRYRDGIKDTDWSDFEANYQIPEGKTYSTYHSTSLIHKLYSMIKYQFEKSYTRRAAYRSFNAWYKEFVKLNYYKSRGSLGGTLKLDKEGLLLFTEMSIMSSRKEKILISQLWLQLERRGILLDNQSKREVVNFFEKINILEKKSDSGDAQYVTRLYNR
ncbi:DNA phosphorothioation-dependent restriction protein DptG [Desertivirga brevis]|uniref:DNA phosphorothioation-dependent restriction protein DptG n=1 Tax=Desertivirga brevis TaxID=2810310 RepID=UPI001A96A5DC|nr:DNA phosphorothioation-dependent restriction protein DptG [Pedobacter sp. SYSU D00873]